ncbi:MAG: Uma2 family endonuclease [Planctomycetota bacterium]
MSTTRIERPQPPVIYPDSDGEPMAESETQWEWLALLKHGLQTIFEPRRHEVFVGSDQFWYPVQGDPTIRTAPDVMVVFGRPRDPLRRSWLQWEENDLPPAVVIEVRSHTNSDETLDARREFGERYGVSEFWIIDPEPDAVDPVLSWHRMDDRLVARDADDWHSPLLGITFQQVGRELIVVGPAGERLLSYHEQRERAEDQARRADALARKLRSLGIDPDTVA